MIPPFLSYAPFLFRFLCPLRFPFFKFFLPLRAFKEFLNFGKQAPGKGFYFMLGDICVRVLFCHISPFSIFSFQGTMPLCGVKMSYPIIVPLYAVAAVSVLPTLPAGYGQPAAAYRPVRFLTLPVPLCLSSYPFRWLWLWLPVFHFPLTGH